MKEIKNKNKKIEKEMNVYIEELITCRNIY